jgi:hypothetical protein|tara:strand:+ start:4250 stop:5548 length:1299 start_codon:yes stop_codon:yes gene_type:complete
MSYIAKKIELYHKSGDTWNTTADLNLAPDVIDFDVSKGIGSIKDAFKLMIQRGQDYFNGEFKIVADDRIKIWVNKDANTFTDADDLLIDGVVRGVEMSIGEKGHPITVKGYDFSETVFDAQIPVNYQNLTCMEMARDLVEREELSGRGVTWNASNPTVKKDGTTSFPKKNLTLNYTAVHQILDKILSSGMTEDGNYIWYINNSQELVIRAKTTTIESTTIKEGTDTTDIKVTLMKDGIVNFIVWNAGNDLKGNSVVGVTYNTSSIGKYGFKSMFGSNNFVHIYDDLLQKEIGAPENADSNPWPVEADLGWTSTNPDDHYPTFNYTWITESQVDGALISTSKDDFINDSRQLAEEEAQDLALSIIDNRSKPRYRIEIGYSFRNDLVLGGLYSIVIPSRNINTNMRLVEMTFNVNGVLASFEQDETDASFEEAT